MTSCPGTADGPGRTWTGDRWAASIWLPRSDEPRLPVPPEDSHLGGIMPGGLVEAAAAIMHSIVSVLGFLVAQRFFVRGLVARTMGD